MDIIINAKRAELEGPEAIGDLPQGSYLVNLLVSLGFSLERVPIADFLRQYHHLEGEWALCEPIYWEAFHNDAMLLADARMLGFSETESKALFLALADFLKPEGLALYYHDAHTWLMKVDGKPKINSLPTHCMINQSMMAVLEGLDAGHYWQKILTELQMFVHQEKYSALPVNGFWISDQAPFAFKAKQAILSDDEKLIAAFPGHVHEFLPEKIDKNSIVLLKNYEAKQQVLLDQLAEKYRIHWFWNNKAYITQPKTWWRRWKRRD